jgi:hypothetical protein
VQFGFFSNAQGQDEKGLFWILGPEMGDYLLAQSIPRNQALFYHINTIYF